MTAQAIFTDPESQSFLLTRIESFLLTKIKSSDAFHTKPFREP
jgi:hypothetical protein